MRWTRRRGGRPASRLIGRRGDRSREECYSAAPKLRILLKLSVSGVQKVRDFWKCPAAG
jgi:hypothetical protein